MPTLSTASMRLGAIQQIVAPRAAALSGPAPLRPCRVSTRPLTIAPPQTNMATKWNQTDVAKGTFGFNVSWG